MVFKYEDLDINKMSQEFKQYGVIKIDVDKSIANYIDYRLSQEDIAKKETFEITGGDGLVMISKFLYNLPIIFYVSFRWPKIGLLFLFFKNNQISDYFKEEGSEIVSYVINSRADASIRKY